MADTTLSHIRPLLPEEALPLLDEYVSQHPKSDEAFLLRGMKHWAAGHRAAAINDYHTALSLNPDSDAGKALSVANSILSFYNKDLLNP